MMNGYGMVSGSRDDTDETASCGLQNSMAVRVGKCFREKIQWNEVSSFSREIVFCPSEASSVVSIAAHQNPFINNV